MIIILLDIYLALSVVTGILMLLSVMFQETEEGADYLRDNRIFTIIVFVFLMVFWPYAWFEFCKAEIEARYGEE